ncbi:hypothetical protein [Halorussus marinus]|uniref:hypothetical protein n=1 Tax=Halorussus marinus TaxID=2505976 RepID=UPI001091882B|nr:hypothetical protein [Halorussus marinus]
MSEDMPRVIRKADHGVSVELELEESEKGFTTMKFSEIRLLENGWVECRDPNDEEERRNFFPPWKVQNIVVYDEDKPKTTL